jgi:hypothetical protein
MSCVPRQYATRLDARRNDRRLDTAQAHFFLDVFFFVERFFAAFVAFLFFFLPVRGR